MNRTFFMRALALAFLLALAGPAQFSCDENPSDNSSKLRITAYSGNNQTERAGAMLPAPLVVRVSDILGNAKPGVPVEFSSHGEPLASVNPQTAATDANGFASCGFKLGTRVGTQHVWATTAEDSTVFSATAVALACPEENPAKICQWPAGHIFIATASSSLMSGSGSIVIDYNPANGEITPVIETSNPIDGISFSSRGELFVSSPNRIWKVNHETPALEDYIAWAGDLHISMDPNPGSILAGLAITGPVRIDCPSSEVSSILAPHTFNNNLKWQTVAVDPVTRDIYMISESLPTSYALWRVYWDGRTSEPSFDVVKILSVGAAAPAGMCVDSTGTVYIVFDGNDSYRRIVSVTSTGTVDYDFFNFYTYYGGTSIEAGRWGDIAYLGGKLYVIDRRNDRLVIISKHGTWLDEVKDPAFSRPLDEIHHYAICASPTRICTTKK
ncbi:MAG: hypothetical protein NTW97_10675 [Candidatus Krumholzibacteria bacterium]|nr:hypothetical protein [Candidatus Krumholzibacteria bacterium]